MALQELQPPPPHPHDGTEARAAALERATLAHRQAGAPRGPALGRVRGARQRALQGRLRRGVQQAHAQVRRSELRRSVRLLRGPDLLTLEHLHLDHEQDLLITCDMWKRAAPDTPSSWDDGIHRGLLCHLLFGVCCGSVERVALSAGVRRVRVESSVCVCAELGRQEARCGRWVSAQGAAVSIDRGMCQCVDPRSCTALGGSYWRGRTSHRHRAISLTEVHGHHIFRRGY